MLEVALQGTKLGNVDSNCSGRILHRCAGCEVSSLLDLPSIVKESSILFNEGISCAKLASVPVLWSFFYRNYSMCLC